MGLLFFKLKVHVCLLKKSIAIKTDVEVPTIGKHFGSKYDYYKTNAGLYRRWRFINSF